MRILFLIAWLNLTLELSLGLSDKLAPADHTKEKIRTIEQQASASKLDILSRFCFALNYPNKILKMLMKLWTRLLSWVAITYLHSSLSHCKFYLNSPFILSTTFTIYAGTAPSFLRYSLKVIDHVSMIGYQPRCTGSI